MSFCEECGSKIPDGNSFCSSCGTPVPAAGTPPKDAGAKGSSKGSKDKGDKGSKGNKADKGDKEPGGKGEEKEKTQQQAPPGDGPSGGKGETTSRQPLPPRQEPSAAAVASADTATKPRNRRAKKTLISLALIGILGAVAIGAIAKFYNPTQRAVASAAEDSVVKQLKESPDEGIGSGSDSNAFLGELSSEGLAPRVLKPSASATVNSVREDAAVAVVDVNYSGGVEGDDAASVIPVDEKWRVGLRKNQNGDWKPSWYYVTASTWKLPEATKPTGADLKVLEAATEKAVKDFGTLDGEDYEAWNKAQVPNYVVASDAPTLDGYEEGDPGSSPATSLLYAILWGDNGGESDEGDLSLDSLSVSDVSAAKPEVWDEGDAGKFLSIAQTSVTARFGGGTFSSCGLDGEEPPLEVDSEVVFLVQVARSRLGSNGKWRVTRMSALDLGSDTDETTQVDISAGSSYRESDSWDEATSDASYESGDGQCD